MLKSELQKYAAPVLDEDYCNIVVSAVRYALPRHSYMPSLTRGYLKRHWPHLAKMHWCILRDIREYHDESRQWIEDSLFGIDLYDYNEWINFYNYLIAREDTTLEPHSRKEHTPLTPIPET
jgi:hypothetical protein